MPAQVVDVMVFVFLGTNVNTVLFHLLRHAGFPPPLFQVSNLNTNFVSGVQKSPHTSLTEFYTFLISPAH